MLKENWRKERTQIQKLLDQIKLEKPSFGKPYYKLDIIEGELESLKMTLNTNL